MTPDEIARLRALCEKATPGPWKQSWTWTGKHSMPMSIETQDEKRVIGTLDEYEDQSGADSAFIAEARTALPAALVEIERLRFLHNNGHPSFEQVSSLQRHIKETGELVRDLTAKIVFMASALGIPEGVDPSRTNIENAVTRIGNEIARLRGMILDLGLDPDAGAK